MKKLRKVIYILGILILLPIAIILFGYCYGSRHFVVKECEVCFDSLPPQFDGYRIVQFSDFHAGAFHCGHDKDVSRLIDLINAQQGDIICFTGDLVTRESSELEGFTDELRRLKAHDGVYSVMGNHDYSLYRRISLAERKADIQNLQRLQRSFGWNLLLNDKKIISKGNDSIAIIGVENDGTPPHFPAYANLPKALDGIDSNTFKVLLSHDPTHWKRNVMPETNINLTISGHTHAGQLLIFGWSPVDLVYKEWTGLYEHNGRYLHISNGVGCVPLPFRIGAWPEINVITLKRNVGKSK